MTNLAAVNIRQYSRANEAVAGYSRTVEIGLGMLLRLNPELLDTPWTRRDKGLGLVAFGTDQGMCGQLNALVQEQTIHLVRDSEEDDIRLLVMGDRLFALFADTAVVPESSFAVPGSVEAIAGLVSELLVRLEAWTEEGVSTIKLVNSRPGSGVAHEPVVTQLLPLYSGKLKIFKEKMQNRRGLPMYTMEPAPLLSALVRQYLFVTLYRAATESMTSENSSRLAAMQGAERNIEDQLDRLGSTYRQRRQITITDELLDIVSGFEALQDQGSDLL